jgi:hypothetical protein
MTELFSIKWNGEQPAADQQDACFHRYTENYFATVTLTKNGETYSTDIYIDGEMHLNIPYLKFDGTENPADCEIVRYSDDLERYAKTDAELSELISKWEKQGVDLWVHNPWFDLYTEVDGVSEHLDAVTHEVDDAVNQAKAVLQEVAEVGGWQNYFAKH